MFDVHAEEEAVTAAPVVPGRARRQATQARAAEAFAQIVAVLMRDPAYRGLTLGELEELVLPPLLAGQYSVAHAGPQSDDMSAPSAMAFPVALALWANVSAAVDARLSSSANGPLRLQAAEWVSGDVPWLIVVAGHPRAIPVFLKQLKETRFHDKALKMRTGRQAAQEAGH